MNLFWDSSALVKFYIEEEGSSDIRKLKGKHNFSAALSHAEILAAFYRLRREGIISKNDLEGCLKSFKEDFQKLLIIDYSEQVRDFAERLIVDVALRGADLIQLSSAYALQAEGLEISLVTFDQHLKIASEDIGLKNAF